MSFIDSFEHELVEAGRRRRDAHLRRRVPRWLRAGGPRRRGAAAVLAALAVAVPATAATVGWNPFDDSDRNPRLSAPSASTRPVDRELAATLGVLRRPQTAVDRSALTRETLRDFGGQGFRGVHLDGIRLVDRERGIVLVPLEEPPVPRDERGRPMPGFESSAPVACLVEPTSDGFTGIGCHTAAKVRSGLALSSGSGRITGLVPDGVARVRLTRGDDRADAVVRNNVFVAGAPAPTAPRFVDWLAADGATIRRIDVDASRPAERRTAPPGP